jgi:hypothetical protein
MELEVLVPYAQQPAFIDCHSLRLVQHNKPTEHGSPA